MEADQAAIVLARWIYYGAVMTLFGSSLFPLYALAGRDPAPALLPRAANVTLALAALVAAFGWLLGFAATLAGPEDWADILKAILFESSFGAVWVVRLLGALLLLGATLLRHPGLMAALCLILLACEGWSGHAAAWGLVGSITMVAHVVSASAWMGGLVPLGRFVRAAQQGRYSITDAQVVLVRFSRLGIAAVGLIAVTGAVNTWRMLGMAPDPMDAYGRVLLAKIVLFGFMLVLAVTNRYWLMPQLSQQGRPLGALVRTILLEQALAAGVLLAVSALGLMDPST
jgi:putative copper resistance protein D